MLEWSAKEISLKQALCLLDESGSVLLIGQKFIHFYQNAYYLRNGEKIGDYKCAVVFFEKLGIPENTKMEMSIGFFPDIEKRLLDWYHYKLERYPSYGAAQFQADFENLIFETKEFADFFPENSIVEHFKREFLSDEASKFMYQYRVLGLAVDTSTDEKVVIYQALYCDENGRYLTFTRPIDDFLDVVNKGSYPDIKRKYKFCRII